MKKVFLDTHIIVDLIADRKPFSKYATDIFKKAERKELTIYISSHSIATTHYLLKKYLDEQELRKILESMLDFIHVISEDFYIIRKGLRSKYKDFEDAIQIFCASAIHDMDCIVTRNAKDFSGSEISVITPDEFCDRL